jgi:hypothetical protein
MRGLFISYSNQPGPARVRVGVASRRVGGPGPARNKITVEGLVESVEYKNPHSIIVVRQDDRTASTVDWLPLDGLTRNRILESAKGALGFGARVSVTGAPIRTAAEIRGFFPDFKGEVNPRTIDPWLIRRVGDTFSWALPQSPNPANCAGIFRTPAR